MPKTNTTITYECNYCHKLYDSEKAALNCEQIHIEPKIIFRSYNSAMPYPTRLTVEMPDGQKREYVLSGADYPTIGSPWVGKKIIDDDEDAPKG